MTTTVSFGLWLGGHGPDAPILGVDARIRRDGQVIADRAIYVRSPENKAWATRAITAVGGRTMRPMDNPLGYLATTLGYAHAVLHGPEDMWDWSVPSVAAAEDAMARWLDYFKPTRSVWPLTEDMEAVLEARMPRLAAALPPERVDDPVSEIFGSRPDDEQFQYAMMV